MQDSVGVDGVPEPRKPNVVDVDGASAALYDTLRTDTVEPLVLTAPFQICVMPCPLPSVHWTVHPLIGALPAVTVTSPWKAPCHAPTVR